MSGGIAQESTAPGLLSILASRRCIDKLPDVTGEMGLVTQGKNNHVGSSVKTDAQQHDDMRYLVNFERLIITLSGRFINLTSKSLDKEKEFLLREIHHRVKNNMQIIQSLLYLQADALRDQIDPIALDGFAQSQSRIKSMAIVHDRLYRSNDLASIDFEDYLNVLIPSLISSYGVAEQVEAEITTENVRFGITFEAPDP